MVVEAGLPQKRQEMTGASERKGVRDAGKWSYQHRPGAPENKNV